MIKRTNLFRSKEAEEVSESSNSHLAAPQTEIPVSESGRNNAAALAQGLGRGTKTLVATFAFVLFVIVLIHTALAGSLMFTASVDGKSSTERAWVARGTFVGGKIDPGAVVYGSTTEYAPTDFISKVIQGHVGAPDYFIGEVIAGPVAKVETNKEGKVLVNGKDSGYKGKTKESDLKNQYLAVCVSGACEEGDLIIADYASISGEVRGYLYPFGLEKIHTMKDSNGNESK